MWLPTHYFYLCTALQIVAEHTDADGKISSTEPRPSVPALRVKLQSPSSASVKITDKKDASKFPFSGTQFKGVLSKKKGTHLPILQAAVLSIAVPASAAEREHSQAWSLKEREKQISQ